MTEAHEPMTNGPRTVGEWRLWAVQNPLDAYAYLLFLCRRSARREFGGEARPLDWEDLSEQVLYRLAYLRGGALAHVRPGTVIEAFVRKVTRNAAIDLERSERRRKPEDGLDPDTFPETTGPGDGVESVDTLHAAIRPLSIADRQFASVLADEPTIRAAAARLGLPVWEVAERFRRILRSIESAATPDS